MGTGPSWQPTGWNALICSSSKSQPLFFHTATKRGQEFVGVEHPGPRLWPWQLNLRTDSVLQETVLHFGKQNPNTWILFSSLFSWPFPYSNFRILPSFLTIVDHSPVFSSSEELSSGGKHSEAWFREVSPSLQRELGLWALSLFCLVTQSQGLKKAHFIFVQSCLNKVGFLQQC